MALLDNIGKKITATTQNVVRGTKDLTDIARLNSLISDEQKQVTNLYAQIGKLYYETAEYDPDSALGKLCLAITASNDRIAKYDEDIRTIKGSRRCPQCGENVPLSSGFCGICGAKMEDAQNDSQSVPAKRFCTGCGEEISDGMVFCTSCGQKVE